MRHLLRRVVAFVVLLSVLSSTLGAAHASCALMTDGHAMHGGDAATVASGATHGSHDMASHHRAPKSPAGHEGTGACPLVAHCGTMLPALHDDGILAGVQADPRDRPTDDIGPRAPTPELDSPPPRG